jgi:hypothetical protein
MAQTVFVEMPDVRGVVADLESVELGLGDTVVEALREAGTPILAEMIRLAPFDPRHRGWQRGDRPRGRKRPDPGHIAHSLRQRATRAGIEFYSQHKGAAVHEFGGTIAPRGTAIRIQPVGFALRAGEAKADEVAARGREALDRLLSRHGL